MQWNVTEIIVLRRKEKRRPIYVEDPYEYANKVKLEITQQLAV